MKRPVILRQETLQLMLPDIPPAFCEQMRALTGSLAQQGKEPVMQRKISIGLVAALVALLITMGALAAALLSGKDFVEQELAPPGGAERIGQMDAGGTGCDSLLRAGARH